MKDSANNLRTRLDRLAELARHAAPEERARLERSIRLTSQAVEAVVQAQQVAQRAARLKEEADAKVVHRRSELAALLAELRILRNRFRKLAHFP
jgi:hypothetical protein